MTLKLALMVLLVAIVALTSAVYLGLDLYRGLFEGGFTLVRGNPISSGDGFRYWLIFFGEGLALATLASCAGLMVYLFVRGLKARR